MKNFNYDHIEELIDAGIEMRHKRKFKLNSTMGLYLPDRNLILIKQGMTIKNEGITILHEWLHAYEDKILQHYHTERVVDSFANFYYLNCNDYLDYIKSFYNWK